MMLVLRGKLQNRIHKVKRLTMKTKRETWEEETGQRGAED